MLTYLHFLRRDVKYFLSAAHIQFLRVNIVLLKTLFILLVYVQNKICMFVCKINFHNKQLIIFLNMQVLSELTTCKRLYH